MRNFKEEAIVIKRRNYGEADRMLTIFTKNYGKMSVVAKGVRRITSKRASHIELLNQAVLYIHKGKGMPILGEAQVVSHFEDIKQDLTKVGFAYHLCELIDGLCPDGQENRTVYSLFLNTLKRLESENEIAPVIHEFEIELLSLLGFFSRHQPTQQLNTTSFIENILERRLKSRQILNTFNK